MSRPNKHIGQEKVIVNRIKDLQKLMNYHEKKYHETSVKLVFAKNSLQESMSKRTKI